MIDGKTTIKYVVEASLSIPSDYFNELIYYWYAQLGALQNVLLSRESDVLNLKRSKMGELFSLFQILMKAFIIISKTAVTLLNQEISAINYLTKYPDVEKKTIAGRSEKYSVFLVKLSP
jgi:hypothetical protein